MVRRLAWRMPQAQRPARTGPLRAALRRGRAVGLALLVSLGVACVPPPAPAGGAQGAPAWLYVANALDDTITRFDGASGRVAGPPLPGGPQPGAVAPGPAGSVLVLSMAAEQAAWVTLVAWRGGAWVAQPVPIGAATGATLLASDGGPAAVAAYQAADAEPREPSCRLALIDAGAGAVVRTTTVCRPGERVGAVAFAGRSGGGGSPGAVAYLAIRPLAPAPVGGPARVVAVDAATGRVLVGLPLTGIPSHLVLAPAPGGAGARLYVVEQLAPEPLAQGLAPDGSDGSDGSDGGAGAPAGRLLGLDPESLEVRSVQPLTQPPLALAVGSDGARAYALVGGSDPARSAALTELDLAAGTERPFAALPGGALGLAVSAARVYASAPTRDLVWALDRRTGRLTATLPAGRGPAGLALGATR